MFATAAIAPPSPGGIELFRKRLNQNGIIGQNSVLEVALAFRLHPHSGARKIGTAEIRLDTIYDNALEMDARTKHPLHRRPERRIAVEVIPRFTIPSNTSKNGTLSLPPESTYMSLMSATAIHNRFLICGTIPQITDS